MEKEIKYAIRSKDGPLLYSFDIFDTLIRREGIEPIAIFFYVQKEIKKSSIEYPQYILDNYPQIRMDTEKTIREYFKKSLIFRRTDKLEIFFDDIFLKIGELYSLSSQQIEYLKKIEVEIEMKSVRKITKRIKHVKNLLSEGNQVILISDMYLPEHTIKQMLKKADPILLTIPLFLSSKSGYQKSTGKLYEQIQRELNIPYSKWIHHGDNYHADIRMAEKLGIKTVYFPKLSFNKYEKNIINKIDNHDAYLLADLLANYRESLQIDNELVDKKNSLEYYVYGYVSQYFVPYIYNVLEKAIKKEIKTLYFISRDGYFLKKVADEIILQEKLPIKTKYIYGSRLVWRTPSYIDGIDDEFFSEFGNLISVRNYSELLISLELTEQEFDDLFPNLNKYKKQYKIDEKSILKILKIVKKSQKYNALIVEKAKKERNIIVRYLRQEINVTEKFAFVEYWGRGYTQTCLARLMDNAFERKLENIFFYARSIYPSHGSIIRENFTVSPYSLTFIEALFSNIPYQSIQKYQVTEDGIIIPEIIKREYDITLHDCMLSVIPQYIKEYRQLDLSNKNYLERAVFDFSIEYFQKNQTDKNFLKYFSTLKDALRVGEKDREYAPKLKIRYIVKYVFMRKKQFNTRSMRMSIEKSNLFTKYVYKISIEALTILKKICK